MGAEEVEGRREREREREEKNNRQTETNTDFASKFVTERNTVTDNYRRNINTDG